MTLYENNLNTLTDDGELQDNNDILDIEAFQMPPAIFHYYYNSDNPILLYGTSEQSPLLVVSYGITL